ncbi:hypothetical protein [Planktotalea sp.]|uniref:hypothetical protein n=1 Tax=Planktotalea sp. TaxID=2029877 RepID=UPI003F6D652F
MNIPKLKRATIASEDGLRVWLKNNSDLAESVMLVTHSNPRSSKHVSTEQVANALTNSRWSAGRRYTLNDNLLGHVITLTA